MQADNYVFGEFQLLSDEELEKSPSRALGMSREEEENQLNTAARFVLSLADAIRLDCDKFDGKAIPMRFWTRDGAIALTRRYFSRRSLQNNDRYLIATAALMLFMKSEGEHRNVREFAYCMKAVRSKNPAEKEQLMRKYNERRGDDTDIIATIDSILFAERAILYALNFSIHNDHPYDMFVKLVTSNKMGAGCPLVPPGQEKAHEQWISATGQALTTSFKKTQLCLQYPCNVLMCAAMELMCEKLQDKYCGYKIPLPTGKFFMQDALEVDPALLKVVKQKLYDGCFMSSAPAAAPKAAAVAGAPPMPTFRPVIIPAGGAVPSSLDPPLVVKAVNNAEETFEGVAHTHAHAEPQVRSIPPSAYAAADGKAKEGEMEEGEVVSSSRGIHCSLSSTVLQQNGALEALLSDSSDHAPQNHENDPAPALAPVPVSALPAAVHDAAVMEMTTSPNGTNPDSCPQSNHLNNENGSEGQQPSVLKRARCEEGEVTEPPGKQLRV